MVHVKVYWLMDCIYIFLSNQLLLHMSIVIMHEFFSNFNDNLSYQQVIISPMH